MEAKNARQAIFSRETVRTFYGEFSSGYGAARMAKPETGNRKRETCNRPSLDSLLLPATMLSIPGTGSQQRTEAARGTAAA